MYNYVDVFLTQLEQKYSRELTSSALTTDRVMFVGAKTVKIPGSTWAGIKIITGREAGTGKLFRTISS